MKLLHLSNGHHKWLLVLLGLGLVFGFNSDKGSATGGVWDYTGRAFFQPAENHEEDTSVVVFPQPLPDDNYTVVIGGTKISNMWGANGTFDVFLDGAVLLPTQTAQGFTLAARWTVYNAATSAWFGSWTNRLDMLAAIGVVALPIEPHVD